MNLREKTARSGVAVMVGRLSVRFVSLFSAILLARLLNPSDFGLVGIGALLVGTFTLFALMGMGPALVTTKEETNQAAFFAFVITTSLGGLMMVCMFFFAPAFAVFFENTNVISICRWMSVLIILQALTLVPGSLLKKEMMFGRQLIPIIAGPLSGAFTAVGLALSGFGFWSLVAGQIVKSLVVLIATFVLCPNLRWFRFQKLNKQVAKSMSSFGLTAMSTSFIRYGYNNGDDVIVSKIFGITQLGFYQKAFELSMLPVNYITEAANQVLVPAFTKVRSDRKRLAQAFMDTFSLIATLTIPLTVGMFILAPEMITIILGEKWRGAVPIFQAFVMLGLIRPLSATTGSLFFALELPNYNLRIALIQFFSIFSLIFFLIKFGSVGVALAVAVSFFFGFVYNMFLTCRRSQLELKVKDIFEKIWPILIATAIMAISVILTKEITLDYFLKSHNIWSLILMVCLGVISYFLSLFFIKKSRFIEIINLFGSTAGLGEDLWQRLCLKLQNYFHPNFLSRTLHIIIKRFSR